MKLRAAIEQAQKTGTLPEGDVASITATSEEAEDAIVQQQAEPKETVQKKAQNKSRVGSMFDLLTFSDI